MKRILSVLLAVLMLHSLFALSASAEQPYSKSENVYAVLNADGSAGDVYVVNVFDLPAASQVTDYGAYTEVTNLSTEDMLDTGLDFVSFKAEAGLFYYEGREEQAELPWEFELRYYLDEIPIAPEELGGSSGHLRIELETKRNSEGQAVYFNNYLLQISFSLRRAVFQNLVAEGATLADAGASKQISFTGMPGKKLRCVVEMDVTDFEMDGISIAAVPYSMSIDTEELGIDEMKEAFSSLTDGAKALNDGITQAADGAKQLADNGPALKEGSSQISEGLGYLSSNGAQLVSASSQFKDAFKLISEAIGLINVDWVQELEGLQLKVPEIDQALDNLESAVQSLPGAVEAITAAVDSSIDQLDSSVSMTDAAIAELEAYFARLPEDAEPPVGALEQLRASNALVASSRDSLINAQPQLEAIKTTVDCLNIPLIVENIESFRDMLHRITQSELIMDAAARFTELQNGLFQLADGYSQFHDGLCAYVGGVDYLYTNYTSFNSGLAQYVDGVSALSDGLTQLSDGSEQFYAGVSLIPDELQTEVDKMLSQYMGGDFELVSFTDARNKNIEAVQFVISTPAISAPASEQQVEQEEQLSFWERFTNLFS